MRRALVVLFIVVVAVLGVAQLNAQGVVTLEDVVESVRLLTRKVEVQDAYSDTLATKVADLTGRVEVLENPPTATPIPTSTPVPESEGVVVVTSDIGNVRAGPGTQHEVLGQVHKGDVLQGPLQESGGWYQVCCVGEGETVWISQILVEKRLRAELTAWETALSSAEVIDPEPLLRYNSTHVGKIVYFSGVYVVQAEEEYLIVCLDEDCEHPGWLVYPQEPVRVLAEDTIEVVGIVQGLHTYETRSERTLTVPWFEVVELRLED